MATVPVPRSDGPIMTAPLVLDSVTHLTAEARGRIAVCASHGAVYAAWYGARKGVSALILNDAGIGREQAGISGLEFLDGLGVPAATVAHSSARIGWGADMPARGVLSFVNAAAASVGLRPGMACAAALDLLARADLTPSPEPEPLAEARHEIAEAGSGTVRVFVLDSNGLIGPEDAGHVVVTASHGAIIAIHDASIAGCRVVSGPRHRECVRDLRLGRGEVDHSSH